jgi:hypothetical protein
MRIKPSVAFGGALLRPALAAAAGFFADRAGVLERAERAEARAGIFLRTAMARS